MAYRTYYYQLAFEGGDLQDIREAATGAFGLKEVDLDESEKDARDWCLRLLTAAYGWGAAHEWDLDWTLDTNTYPDHTPRSIRMLAQKFGSAFVWQKYERYNRIVQSDDEGAPLLISQILLREAKELWESIEAAGVLVYEDGTDAIDLTAASGTTGYGISGAEALIFADDQSQKSYGISPEFSTEKLLKELTGL